MICNKPQLRCISSYQDGPQSSKSSLKRIPWITQQRFLFLQQIELAESGRLACVTATGCCSQEAQDHLEDKGSWFQSSGNILRNCIMPETRQQKWHFLVASTPHSHSIPSFSLCTSPSLMPASTREEEEGKYLSWWRKKEGVGSLGTWVRGLPSSLTDDP